MSRKRIRNKFSHRMMVPQEVARPKGSAGVLSRAVERLAPYESIWVKDDGSRQPLSRALAVELVCNIARMFNVDECLVRDAPRFSDVMERLQQFRTRAAVFARFIESTDDLTLSILRAGGGWAEGQELNDLLQDADVEGLAGPDGHENRWGRRLRALSKCADLSRHQLAKTRERQGRGKDDLGGQTNMFKEEQGPPRWRLVTECLSVYDLFKPGLATTTKGGSFHLFVLDVFEYATAQEGEVAAKVDFWIKRLVKATRDEKILGIQERSLNEEIDKIILSDDRSPEMMSHIAAMMQEVRNIHAEREDLWRKTWPHV